MDIPLSLPSSLLFSPPHLLFPFCLLPQPAPLHSVLTHRYPQQPLRWSPCSLACFPHILILPRPERSSQLRAASLHALLDIFCASPWHPKEQRKDARQNMTANQGPTGAWRPIYPDLGMLYAHAPTPGFGYDHSLTVHTPLSRNETGVRSGAFVYTLPTRHVLEGLSAS